MVSANNTPYRTLVDTLRGHEEEINRISWSPDGRWLASSSFDKTVRIWDTQTGLQFQKLEQHTAAVYGVAWSPDGQYLASCSQDKRVLVWNTQTWQALMAGEKKKSIYNITWPTIDQPLPDPLLASCSADQKVQLWTVHPIMSPGGSNLPAMFDLLEIGGHYSEVYDVAGSPLHHIMVSGSAGNVVNIWNIERAELGFLLGVLRSHQAAVYSLAWSPNAPFLASGSEDCTIRIWSIDRQYTETGSVKQTSWNSTAHFILEGHTGAITSVSFSYDGRLLASKSRDGTIGLWRTDTWELVDTIEAPASNGIFAGLAFHPSQPLLATVSEGDKALQVWRLNISVLLGLEPPQPTVHYVSAKVVLAGDSGVGKTALGRALAGLPFLSTESSPGRFVHAFKSETIELAENRQEQREIFLWDLAGQSGSRVIHQLHLREAAVALLIFSDMTGGDPLSGIRYWARALHAAQGQQGDGGWPVTKLLVEARSDRSKVRLSDLQIDRVLQEGGLSRYCRTSAQTNEGVNELAKAIEQAIRWDMLPKVTSTELFQNIKAFLIARKKAGYVVETVSNLFRAFVEVTPSSLEATHLEAQFETCIGHLEAQGLLRRLSFGGFVLLFPEKLDDYADALSLAVRAQADQLGSIAEAEVVAGKFQLPENLLLQNPNDERIVLLALVEDLLRYEIAFRVGSYLVFPSEVMRQPQARDPQDPMARSIRYRFEGPVWNIYATLAVRLSQSGFFQNQEFWQNCLVFTTKMGSTCRCELREIDPGEGKAEFALSFDDQASEETRFHFETYICEHLENSVGKERVQRQRLYLCPVCQKAPFTDEIIKDAREDGNIILECPRRHGGLIDIRDDAQRLTRQPDPAVQEEMQREADRQRERSVAQSIVMSKEQVEHHDIFISYHLQEEEAAKEIRTILKDGGYNAWMVDWDATPGLPERPQVEEKIKQMRAAVVLIGNHEVDRERELVLQTLIDEFEKRHCPVIPVILAKTHQQNPSLPPFLQRMSKVDLRRQEPDPLERLWMGIENRRI